MTDDEHAACILAIVGSRDVNKAGGLKAIQDAIERHKPLVIVSGGAKASGASRLRGLISIDEEAEKLGHELGIQVVSFRPTTYQFHGPGGFKERNIKIGDLCQCLVRIASSTTTTYGSGWTADYAMNAGKNVERFVVDEKGVITNG
jgi:hypothetical protein